VTLKKTSKLLAHKSLFNFQSEYKSGMGGGGGGGGKGA